MRFFRFKGPRLGTKLMLLGAVLMIIPFFSYRQLVEMERLLIQQRSSTQLLMAEGVSTLFNGRDELFNDLPVATSDYEPLFAHPLPSRVRLDGRVDDWDDGLRDSFITFGSDQGDKDGDMRLLLGEHEGQLYGFVQVVDQRIVYRAQNILRLDNSDHLRLNFIPTNGEDARIALVAPREGVTTAYNMESDWRFAVGRPERRVQGAVLATEEGLDIEFRMPLDLLGSRRFFGLSYADVDDPTTRVIENITQTLPTAGKQSFDLVVLHSPEVRKIIEGLGYAGARILVIDMQSQVRAETGSFRVSDPADRERSYLDSFREWFESIRPTLHQVTLGETYAPEITSLSESQNIAAAVITASLAGDPTARRRAVGEGQRNHHGRPPDLLQRQ